MIARRRAAPILSLVSGLLALSSSPTRAETAAETLAALFPAQAAPKVRFVKGERGNDLTYGAEGEFFPKQAPALLRFYMPPKEYAWQKETHTEAQWLGLSHDERLSAWGRGRSGWKKTSIAPAELIDELDTDGFDRAEIVTKPFATLEELIAFQRRIEKEVSGGAIGKRGQLYWQANVAFKKRSGGFVAKNRAGIDGYLRATADYAQFGKLHHGYLTHKVNSEYLPAANLSHFILGPMSRTDTETERGEIDAAAKGQSYYTLTKNHYVQGTYFRTWAYGKERDGFEIRDPHKDAETFDREARRLTLAMERGFSPYAAFRNLSMVDHDTERLVPKPLQTLMLVAMGGASRRIQADWNGEPLWRRFMLPLRPFEREYPEALGLDRSATKKFQHDVAEARGAYMKTLEQLSDASLSIAEKSNQMRVALAKFAHDSGIYPLLDDHFSKIAKASVAPAVRTDRPARVAGKTARTKQARLDRWIRK